MNYGAFTLENYPAMRMNEPQLHTTVWWSLTNIGWVREIKQTRAGAPHVLTKGAKAE